MGEGKEANPTQLGLRKALNVGFRGLRDNFATSNHSNIDMNVTIYNTGGASPTTPINRSTSLNFLSLDQRFEKYSGQMSKVLKISRIDAQRVTDDPEQFVKLQETIRKRQFMTDSYLRQSYNDLLKERVDDMDPLPFRRNAVAFNTNSATQSASPSPPLPSTITTSVSIKLPQQQQDKQQFIYSSPNKISSTTFTQTATTTTKPTTTTSLIEVKDTPLETPKTNTISIQQSSLHGLHDSSTSSIITLCSDNNSDAENASPKSVLFPPTSGGGPDDPYHPLESLCTTECTTNTNHFDDSEDDDIQSQ